MGSTSRNKTGIYITFVGCFLVHKTLFQPRSHLIFTIILETRQGKNYAPHHPASPALFQTRNRIKAMMWLRGQSQVPSWALSP